VVSRPLDERGEGRLGEEREMRLIEWRNPRVIQESAMRPRRHVRKLETQEAAGAKGGAKHVEHFFGIGDVLEDVREHDHIERLLQMQQNVLERPGRDLDAERPEMSLALLRRLDRDSRRRRMPFPEGVENMAISRPHVQNPCRRERQLRGDELGDGPTTVEERKIVPGKALHVDEVGCRMGGPPVRREVVVVEPPGGGARRRLDQPAGPAFMEPAAAEQRTARPGLNSIRAERSRVVTGAQEAGRSCLSQGSR
jgi:hypothetical protein